MLQDDLLSTPIEFLKGVGPDRAALLQKELGIFTFEDLLYHFPFRYVDRTTILPIGELDADMPYIQVVGRIEHVKTVGDAKAKRLVASLRDETGRIDLVWFKGIDWLKKIIIPGAEFIAFGKPAEYGNKLNIVHPELETVNTEVTQGNRLKMQPVYSTTEKLKNKNLDSKGILNLQKAIFEKAGNALTEVLPEETIRRFKLMDRRMALYQMHFPENFDAQKSAERRLKFEELFLLQLRLLLQSSIRKREIKGHIFNKVGDYVNRLYKEFLPFDLTNAQKRVIKEIRADLGSGRQMNRLLQGDVGSGKTIVALMSMLIALDNGMQACLMAPTEILAFQHYESIKNLTQGLGVEVELLTGSTTAAGRKKIEAKLDSSSLHILIGTHALLEDWVKFPSLGLAIIDEQHKFGVAQRAAFLKKNAIPPHILIMTATPIPRTLAMTVYGDLDISTIDELPPGRKPIKTEHRFENKRLQVFGFLKKQVAEGRQVYIVYPLIEESETLDYQNLIQGYENIQREFPMPDYYVSIVHGKMKPAAKDFEMQRFKDGGTQIMVSTTVIEVGVDVPNASVMLIESAERFGLSQLHQLRGRVGRGADQSYCILMTGYKLSNEAKIRMETMVRTNNGFEIAETDMKLRGAGDIAGTQQSGDLNFKIASLSTDQTILKSARDEAIHILDADNRLSLPANQPMKLQLRRKYKDKVNWSAVG